MMRAIPSSSERSEERTRDLSNNTALRVGGEKSLYSLSDVFSLLVQAPVRERITAIGREWKDPTVHVDLSAMALLTFCEIHL